jgi:hypothetical protein
MGQHFLVTLLMIACTAQVARTQTLDDGNTSPLIGWSFTYEQGAFLEQGPGGADQVWDLSTLGTTATLPVGYVSTASTGFAASFPDANVALSNGNGNFEFLRTSPTGLERMGLRYNAQNSTIAYDDPELMLTYPCSFSTTWTDDLSSNFSSSGQPTVRTGSITGVADGFGTVVMPYGTIDNVLRVRLEEDINDLNGLFDIDYDYTTYHYYKPGIRAPLVTFYVLNTVTNGQQNSVSYSLWLPADVVAVNEQLRNTIGMEVFPNPSSDRISILFGNAGGPLVVDILDATGRTVLREYHSSAGQGIGRLDLDVDGLTSGLYHVRLTAANGDQGSHRLIIN